MVVVATTTADSTTTGALVVAGGAGVAGNVNLGGNLYLSGTGARIIGDFTNTTLANRVAFQSSTTNGNTFLNLIPNGTAVNTGLQLDSDSAFTNDSVAQLTLFGGVDFRINSAIRGTGTYLPMTFYTGGSERVRIDTGGNVMFGYTSVINPGSTTNNYVFAGNMGINTSILTANYLLDMVGPTDTSIVRLRATAATTTKAAQFILSTQSARDFVFTSQHDASTPYARIETGSAMTGGLRFYYNGTESARIDTGGNLWVGQTSAVWTERVGVRLSATDAGNVAIGTYTASTTYTGSLVRVQTETAGAGWKMYEGRGAGGAVYYYVDGSGGAYFANNVGVGYTSITNSSSNQNFAVAGQLGIGTNSPSTLKVTIEGSGSQLRIRNTTTRYRSDYIVSNSGSTNINSFDDSGAVYTAINIDTSIFTVSTGSSSNTERMRVDTGGNVMVGYTASPTTVTSTSNFTVAGNVGIGTNTPSYKLQVVGSFAATDVSGIPIFTVDSTGKISMAPYYGNIVIGASTASNSNVVIAATTTSTSTSTGALVVAGGVGIAGNLNVSGTGGIANFANVILSDTSYINTALVYDLDDMTYAADGFTNSFAPTYNQNTVTFTNPWQLLVTIDGAVQAAFDSNYDTIWFGHALTASKGYTIDTTGNIKFADCPPQGASIMARTVVGSPNPTKKVYPFKPLDIMLGI